MSIKPKTREEFLAETRAGLEQVPEELRWYALCHIAVIESMTEAEWVSHEEDMRLAVQDSPSREEGMRRLSAVVRTVIGWSPEATLQ